VKVQCCFFCWRVGRMFYGFYNTLMIPLLCWLLWLLGRLHSFWGIFLQGDIRLSFGSYIACWIWRARIAKFELVPVEDLVKRVVLRKHLSAMLRNFLGWFWCWSSMGGCTKWCFFGNFSCGFSLVFGWVVGCMLICRCIRFLQVLFGTGRWLPRKFLR